MSDAFEEFPFFPFHFVPFSSWSFMVVSHKMEDAVDEKEQNLILNPDPRLQGLALGCFGRYHNISQEPPARRDLFFDRERKGNHIGGAISSEVLVVEAGNDRIIDQDDTQLMIPTSQVF